MSQRDTEIDPELVKQSSDIVHDDLNADPITGEPGAHPVGTGVGATGGAATGAAIGVIGGPLGIFVGSAVGAVVGGLVGKGIAEQIHITEEASYWRENASYTTYYIETRQFYENLDYERDYDPAYRVGYEQRTQYDKNTRFEDIELDLKAKWEHIKGQSILSWEQAKHAVRDAWNRVSH